MDPLAQIKLQHTIKANTEDLQSTLKDLYRWEKDIKKKEVKTCNSDEKEVIPPVRSQIEPESEKIQKEDIKENPTSAQDFPRKSEADLYKTKGNEKVHLKEYDEAAKLYTESITLYDKDPVYFCNRALCYLKLDKYEEAISDCDKAIALDNKFVKAFYRRMQANECLGLARKALDDCSRVLEIDPKNTEAKASFQRINQRIKRYDKNKSLSRTTSVEDFCKPVFTELDGSMVEIFPVDKPAHLRSKKPLKRIEIDEFIEAKTTKNYKNSNLQISDDVIDKLFNSGECGSFVQKKKTESNTENENDSKKLKINAERTSLSSPEQEKGETLIREVIPPKDMQKKNKSIALSATNQINTKMPETPPKTPAEFYSNWKDLTLENKYHYLKCIEVPKLNKILGSGFDSQTLADILQIVVQFYMKDNILIRKQILELSKHSEIPILSMFFSKPENTALANIVAYIKSTENDEMELLEIKKNFNMK